MGYTSRNKRRPFEGASKASHHHLINDSEVQALMERIYKPPRSEDIPLNSLTVDFNPPSNNPVEAIIAVDGGYTEAILDKDFPSRTVHFLQFGALFFKQEDLDQINSSAFISPEDMVKLKNISRLKLALPTKNIRLQDENTLQGSVLKTIFEFFTKNTLDEDNSLIDTVAWFIFRRYKGGQRTEEDKLWHLATNPLSPDGKSVTLLEQNMDKNYTFPCPETGGRIHLTDVFRLHEVIDEETGAAGILGYLVNVIEHIIIIHLIRQLLYTQPDILKKILFIKDGPTGFFGQTAGLHKPMLDLINWLLSKQNILLSGLEKSGPFVDHAQEIQKNLNPRQALILTDEYIYRYILPGGGDPKQPYASSSNYGHKVIFKTQSGQMHVVSLPVKELKKTPTANDLPNLQIILANVEALHCDMYDSALFPVALVNKLVSLSAHPSQRILQKFAIHAIK
ncbi:NurA domain-containing protein [Nodularia spumigena CS-586/05]|uniref:NurA domain-containing protein n=1 Tax=Nodularia spumigena TaxID=70799 RepID=UPI00232DFF1C|nr:NurA domain-containing protein [Nodularia spumigena]MDB9345890.1 NurA domain-containing protein [Nodularia spumigena CS-588/06]MDB9371293.1 NurA domain-containing protein [Nodularia spumigena CS-586/05]